MRPTRERGEPYLEEREQQEDDRDEPYAGDGGRGVGGREDLWVVFGHGDEHAPAGSSRFTCALEGHASQTSNGIT